MQIFMCYVCLTLVTPWTVARQAPLFIGFSRKEHGHLQMVNTKIRLIIFFAAKAIN